MPRSSSSTRSDTSTMTSRAAGSSRPPTRASGGRDRRGRSRGHPDRDRLRAGRRCHRPGRGGAHLRGEGPSRRASPIVHLGEATELDDWSDDPPAAARRLADLAWPGPLTIIVPRSCRVPMRSPEDVTRSGPGTCAPMRSNSSDSGTGLAAPSANRFGAVSPTTAGHVVDDLADSSTGVRRHPRRRTVPDRRREHDRRLLQRAPADPTGRRHHARAGRRAAGIRPGRSVRPGEGQRDARLALAPNAPVRLVDSCRGSGVA